jgi:uncharacterized protein YjbI with pentapeptide repeats
VAYGSSCVRISRLVAPLSLTAAALVLWAAPAQAAACPAVDPSTGAVTPAPTSGVQWAGCNLAGADLAGADMSSGNLNGADFTNANLANVKLTGTDLMSADLTGASLRGANLMETMLSGATLTGTTLTDVSSGLISGTPAALPSSWILANGYLAGPGADLQYADLGDTDLTNADLSSANLTDAALPQATLTGVNLTGATLTGVKSGGISGTPASLPANWLVRAGFLLGPAANLDSAYLAGTDLSGVTLTGADLNNADLNGASLSNSNLDDVLLNGANLTGVSLAGASLAGVQSSRITGTPASLPAGWQVTGGYLIGPGADLSSADLSSFSLGGADLAGTNLSDATLIDTTLSSAKLTGADLSGATADGANFSGAQLTQAKLTGSVLSEANLTGAQFAGANLTDAGLSDSTVTDAGLSGATLAGASGVGISGSPASLPAHWSIRGGYLIGPRTGTDLTDASFSKVNLTGVDFSGLNLLRTTFDHANLTRANLTKANLTGDDFTSANLTRADLAGATVSSTIFAGTVWSHTTCPNGTSSSTHPHGWCFPPPPSSGFTARRLPMPSDALPNSFIPDALSCASATQCTGGGYYFSTSGTYPPALLRWANKKWSASSAPLPRGASTSPQSLAAVTSMACPSLTRCLAGGNYMNSTGGQAMLLSWSGQKWTAARAPLPANAAPDPNATVYGMSCPSVSVCFAVGQYGNTAAGQDGLILRRSGGKWSAAAAPIPAGSTPVASLNAVSCPSVTLCFAAGWHANAAGQFRPLMLRWSAGKWVVVKVPLPAAAIAAGSQAVDGLACPSATRCIATGYYQAVQGRQRGLLLIRSGKNWTAATAPLPAGAASNPGVTLNAVSCASASRCRVVGGYTNTASQSVGLLLSWSGTSWKAVAAPRSAYMLRAISCPTTARCVAVSNGIGQPVGLTGP